MEENRAQAYLELIHTLLNCPSGSEPQILQDNIELLDVEFLETCELVAEKMAQQGGENGASFLRNLISQLLQLIDINDGDNSEDESPQEYANFILELLQAEDASTSNAAVIHPMLAERQHLLNDSFPGILEQVLQRLIAGENAQTIDSMVSLVEDLAINISNFSGGNRANNIEIAIAAYQIVLNNRQPGSPKFAQTQNNLAAAYISRIKGSRAENVEMAIALYGAALTVYTLEAFPEDWGMAQNNLAAAYANRINGSRAENLDRAIAFFEAALTVRNPEQFPEDWAMIQYNLGNAHNDRINGSRDENLSKARSFYEAALTVYTGEDFPEYWAMIQKKLANA
ncbi:tetratricopeptide repeat protein [Tychonema sp. LEGE 07199]|uniref:tetratricopeptide repeat protein n=1 Tax=unclassified Tychonema TaxID=2642144 RepID=UPI00188165DA|nr:MULTISPECIES: tetratricopeptide repeat protein [unclassified Tychonema]MBE9121433.1 tetratricopeptide repeat protein [Tychonema sp. LEGE 07199]MBE9134651.1 tetratricopeptide repeat protein [Tychonema sp. LEGE 07196]